MAKNNSSLQDLYDLISSSDGDLEKLSGILDGVRDSIKQLTEQYNQGVVSIEDYNEALNALITAEGVLESKVASAEASEAKLTKEREKAAQAAEKQAQKQEELQKKYDECESSARRYGATANTVLSTIAATVKDSNPALAASLGAVQKLIPNITECMKKFGDLSKIADKAGTSVSSFGKLLKVATSPAGIMLLVTAVTTLITHFDDLAQAIGLSDTAITNVKKNFAGLVNVVKTSLTDVAKALVQMVKGNFKEAWQTLKEGFNFKQHYEEGMEAWDTKQAEKMMKDKAKAISVAFSDEFKAYLKEASDSIEAAIDGLMLELNGFVSDKIDLKSETDSVLYKMLGISPYNIEKAKADMESALDEIINGINLDEKSISEEIVNDAMQSIGYSGLEAENWLAERESELYQQRIESLKSFLNEYDNVASQAGSAMSTILELEYENGELTDKQYQKRLKVLKAVEISSIIAKNAASIMNIWEGATAEMANNAVTQMATGDPLTYGARVAAANTKTMISAGLKTAAIGATAAASIASIKSDSLVNSSATPSTSAEPTVTNTFISNSGYQESIDAAKATAQNTASTASNTSQSNVVPVLVVESLNEVQSHMSTVSLNSSF